LTPLPDADFALVLDAADLAAFGALFLAAGFAAFFFVAIVVVCGCWRCIRAVGVDAGKGPAGGERAGG
jgi:hypothetical protein